MGGKAIELAVPIQNKDCQKVYDNFVEYARFYIGIDKSCFVPLGSTLKKTIQNYGDIDIGLSEDSLYYKYRLRANHNESIIDFVYRILKPAFKESIKIDGIGLLSFGFEYEGKISQVDLIVNNNKWSHFMYYSPNEGASKYKGLFRTELLHSISSCIPTDIKPVEYFTSEYGGINLGESKIFWKYTLDKTRGFKLQLKTASGKTKKLKRPLTIEGHDQEISKDVNEVIEILFGPTFIERDLETFEDIWNIILSPEFKWASVLPEIVERYSEIIKTKKLEVPVEVLSYTKSSLKLNI